MIKNILFFFSTTSVGGAETNIIKISRELFTRGYQIYWCYLEDNGSMLKLIDFDVKIMHFDAKPLKFFSSARRYKNFLQDNKIECVLNFGLRVELISRVLSKRSMAKRIISNIRSTDDWRKPYHTFLDKRTQNVVDMWVSNSEAGKLAFQHRESIPSERIKVIYNFIDEMPLDENYASLKSGIPLKIGVLANITVEKGYLDLIPLSSELTMSGIEHEFICAGKDMVNGKFHEAVINNKLSDKFNLLGYITDKVDFFNRIDFFLLPSYLEGLPTVLLEAIAHRKPIIATDVGGVTEIVKDGLTGIIVKPGDIKAMKDAIVSLMVEERRIMMVDKASQSLEIFSKKNIIIQWEQVINPK